MKAFPKKYFLLAVLLIFASVIFFKNAWVSDDAYINFRSVEQVIAGNGPIWNPHERVQAFTSPLWFWLLVFLRYISDNVFLNTVFLSFALWILTLAVIYRLLDNIVLFTLGLLVLISSNAFFDYTSSGLENILGYFLIAVFIYCFLTLTTTDHEPPDSKEKLDYGKLTIASLIVFGLIICVRHDLALLVFPGALYVIWQNKHLFTPRKWLVIFTITLLPFILWSLFSVFYYGFPFPNTAYAKLGTQISRADLARQGLQYFLITIQYDLITLPLIGISVLLAVINRRKSILVMTIGIFLNFLYIINIGGDFMRGRFFSYAFLMATLLLVVQIGDLSHKKVQYALIVSVILYSLLYPQTPLKSQIRYVNVQRINGIADERGYFFRFLSFNRYVLSRFRDERFPQHHLCEQGRNAPFLSISQNIGLYGYCAGTEKIIIDSLALTDPFLARTPVTGYWEIGHFWRDIPPGYIESVAHNQPLIEDPELNEQYKVIALITRSEDLLSPERLKAIAMMNLGWQ